MDVQAWEQVLKSVVLPFAFITINIIIETYVLCTHGRAKDDRTHRMVYRFKKDRRVEEKKTDVRGIEISIRHRDTELLEIEQLPFLDWWSYPSTSVNLWVGSLNTYAIALLISWGRASNMDASTSTIMLVANVIAPIVIIALIRAADQATTDERFLIFPDKIKKASGYRAAALVISFGLACVTLYQFWGTV